MRMGWWSLVIILFVGATFLALAPVETPYNPGSTYRWYDGTLEKVERFDYNGKLAERTLFGEDGKTLLSRKYYSDNKLTYSLIRLDDGRLEEKSYNRDGSALLSERTFAGDGQTKLMERTYENGIMQSEFFFSEKGVVVSAKVFWPDGALKIDNHIDKNGTVIELAYRKDGKTMSTQKAIKINQDAELKEYFADGKTVRRLFEMTAGSVRSSIFNRDGSLNNILSRARNEQGELGPVYDASFYESGRLLFKQFWTTISGLERLEKVDIFDEQGKLKQSVHVKLSDKGYQPDAVVDYDKDGNPSPKRAVSEKEDSFKDSYFTAPDHHGAQEPE